MLFFFIFIFLVFCSKRKNLHSTLPPRFLSTHKKTQLQPPDPAGRHGHDLQHHLRGPHRLRRPVLLRAVGLGAFVVLPQPRLRRQEGRRRDVLSALHASNAEGPHRHRTEVPGAPRHRAPTVEKQALLTRALFIQSNMGNLNELFTGNGFTATGVGGVIMPTSTEVIISPFNSTLIPPGKGSTRSRSA